MKIFLVDDNEKFRKVLKLFLEDRCNHTVVGEVSNGNEFLSKCNLNADIILMDISMPGLNGVQTAKHCLWSDRNLKVIAVSQHKEEIDLQQLIGAGFRGFVCKSDIYDKLNNAIQIVHNNEYYFPDDIAIHDHNNFR